jgi:hypothetical protein
VQCVGQTLNSLSNIAGRYLQTGSVDPGLGGTYLEQQKLTMLSLCKLKDPVFMRTRYKKVENNVVLAANILSTTSIICVLMDDLGYSF